MTEQPEIIGFDVFLRVCAPGLPAYEFRARVTRADDAGWIATCNAPALAVHGDSVDHAVASISAELTRMVEDDLERGRDPSDRVKRWSPPPSRELN